jgi:putative endonuclease
VNNARDAYERGLAVEQKVKAYLITQGLVFKDENFRAKCGEIDLIMKDHHTWVFVEVKYRAHRTHGSAAEMLTSVKRNKLTKTMYVYMTKHRLDPNIIDHRIDLFAVDGNRAKWHKHV